MAKIKDQILAQVSASRESSPTIVQREFDEKLPDGKWKKTPDVKIAEDAYNATVTAIKKEISGNPKYSGKTPEEIVDLINSPTYRTVVTQDIVSARMAQVIAKVISEAQITEGFFVDTDGKINIDNPEIQEKVTAALEYERLVDPAKQGYAGKTKKQAYEMMRNAQILKQTETIGEPPPINQILSGVPYAPNAVTLEEVEEALK